MATIGFLFLLLTPHWLCIFGSKAEERLMNKQELQRQRPLEQISQNLSSNMNGRKPINMRRKLDETMNPPALLTPFNPANPNPIPTTDPNPVPISSPFTPLMNPPTIYPTPVPGNVPMTTPSIPMPVNAPITPGQTWCIARAGVPESALQQGLDYACGIGRVDCSMIQPGASCYLPNSIENHASYAFNSYFQRNPVSSSCDFGGTAVLVNTDPSTGSCIYPSSAIPTSTSPPSTTASSSGVTGSSPDITGSGFMYPPPGYNTYNPGSGSGSGSSFGPDSPPTGNSVPAGSDSMQPFISFIILLTSFSTAKLIMSS